MARLRRDEAPKARREADEFFVLCPRHVEAVRNGEFELTDDMPVEGVA
jgi:hypothetical protein